jgi:hypothetical protein
MAFASLVVALPDGEEIRVLASISAEIILCVHTMDGHVPYSCIHLDDKFFRSKFVSDI